MGIEHPHQSSEPPWTDPHEAALRRELTSSKDDPGSSAAGFRGELPLLEVRNPRRLEASSDESDGEQIVISFVLAALLQTTLEKPFQMLSTPAPSGLCSYR